MFPPARLTVRGTHQINSSSDEEIDDPESMRKSMSNDVSVDVHDQSTSQETDRPPLHRTPPPFFIQPRSDWDSLIAILRGHANSLNCKLSGQFLKVTVGSDDEFRRVQKYMLENGVQFKSFKLKDERPIKIVVRGLPLMTSILAIKTQLETLGFQVHKIYQLRRPGAKKTPMPLFYAQIVPCLKIDEIFSITNLLGTEIKIEKYRGRKGPSQCYNCQGWNHSSEVCTLQIKCLRCSGPHKAKDCTLPFEAPMLCANCGGSHASNWRFCPRHPSNRGVKRNKLPQNPGVKSVTPPAPKQKVQNQRQFPARAQEVCPSISFAAAVSGQTPALAPPPLPTSLMTSLPPAPPKECSILVPEHDECMDTLRAILSLSRDFKMPFLLKAFKKALPALRENKSGVDKAYIIFESIVSLMESPNTVLA